MTRWTRASLPLVWIVFGAGCGGEVAPTEAGHNGPNATAGASNGGSGNGVPAAFGAAGLGAGAIDAGAAVGQQVPPGLAGGSSGAPTGFGSLPAGSSAAASSGPPPKSRSRHLLADARCRADVSVGHGHRCDERLLDQLRRSDGRRRAQGAQGGRPGRDAGDGRSPFRHRGRRQQRLLGRRYVRCVERRDHEGPHGRRGTPTTLTTRTRTARRTSPKSTRLTSYWIEQTPGSH